MLLPLMSKNLRCGFPWRNLGGRSLIELPPCVFLVLTMKSKPASVVFVSIVLPNNSCSRDGRCDRCAIAISVSSFSLRDSTSKLFNPKKDSSCKLRILARPRSSTRKQGKSLKHLDFKWNKELLARESCDSWQPKALKACWSMLVRFVMANCCCCSLPAKPQLCKCPLWQRHGKHAKSPVCPG